LQLELELQKSGITSATARTKTKEIRPPEDLIYQPTLYLQRHSKAPKVTVMPWINFQRLPAYSTGKPSTTVERTVEDLEEC
jgi:hypothetical protein